jgi:cellulose synthase/poly-beta-1,6-N-acetylglucosamine synthase-like glycosyltransferase
VGTEGRRMKEHLLRLLQAFDLAVLGYFVAINTVYLVLSVVAFFSLANFRRRWTARRLGVVMRSSATPGVSVIAPAHNEQASIEESVRSLLLLNHPKFEVIVVNDGSADETLRTLTTAFGLMRAPVAHRELLPTQPVVGLYRSPDHPHLMVIDKANGGKADSINAGINAARHPLICVIDADSLLEPLALMRASLPFIEDPTTIATGGIIRIANGCAVERGRVVRVGLPASWLARFQVVEYLRAFLGGRVGLSAMNALLIISGAFGMFRRDAVIEVGGFRHDTIGEDMEIVARLHRRWRDTRRPYRIAFQPDPVCWTQAPEDRGILENQRNRWQRGTCQVLAYHIGMTGRPRYGAVGLIGMPYVLVFEAAGPLIETLGYVVTLVAVAFGALDWVFAELLFLVAVMFGTLISLIAVLLEEMSFRRYPRMRDLLWLAAVGVLENFGYRQLATWWRLRGVIDYFRDKRGWGAMTRKGFTSK